MPPRSSSDRAALEKAAEFLALRAVEMRNRPPTYAEKRATASGDVFTALGSNPTLRAIVEGAKALPGRVGEGVAGLKDFATGIPGRAGLGLTDPLKAGLRETVLTHGLAGGLGGAALGAGGAALGNIGVAPGERRSVLGTALTGGVAGAGLGAGVGLSRSGVGRDLLGDELIKVPNGKGGFTEMTAEQAAEKADENKPSVTDTVVGAVKPIVDETGRVLGDAAKGAWNKTVGAAGDAANYVGSKIHYSKALPAIAAADVAQHHVLNGRYNIGDRIGFGRGSARFTPDLTNLERGVADVTAAGAKTDSVLGRAKVDALAQIRGAEGLGVGGRVGPEVVPKPAKVVPPIVPQPQPAYPPSPPGPRPASPAYPPGPDIPRAPKPPTRQDYRDILNDLNQGSQGQEARVTVPGSVTSPGAAPGSASPHADPNAPRYRSQVRIDPSDVRYLREQGMAARVADAVKSAPKEAPVSAENVYMFRKPKWMGGSTFRTSPKVSGMGKGVRGLAYGAPIAADIVRAWAQSRAASRPSMSEMLTPPPE